MMNIIGYLVFLNSFAAGISGIETGKVNIHQVGNEDFHCQYVSFTNRFTSGTPIRIFASINYGNESSEVHDSASIWVEDVKTSRFKVCLVQGGRGSEVNTTIDWFAFQGSQSGVHHGDTGFKLFTTGTKCNRVTFPQAFSAVPKLHVTVKHGTPNQKQDAMSVWIANVSTRQFEVCLRESRTFDGPHSNIMVTWMAYERYPPAWKAKESSAIFFSENELPTAESSYALCKNVSFASPFYSPPAILTTISNGGKNSTNVACPVKLGPLSSWVEEVTNTYFRVCIRDSAGYDGQRSNVIAEYLVIGDLDPCTNASCNYYSHCVASSPNKFTCVCENSCPSYEEQVCASNGRTFTNLCLLRKEICRTSGNYTDYHPGSCRGFPLQKGRHTFQSIPSWAEDQCEIIKFEPFIFYPDQKIFIQLTVNHINYSDSAIVHEATIPWVESVNSTQFTACVTRAGRNDYPTDSFAKVDWVAYQGAPSGGVAGEEMYSRWWTGTRCKTVTLPKGKFSRPPTIFATAEHHRSGLKHDATSVWLEDVSARSFKICLRELQNFAGVHDDISVNWLAFEFLHRPLFSEHDDVSFENKGVPSENHNFAFCQDLSFIRNYTKAPTVVLTAKHSTSGGNAAAECNGIVSWIEFITKTGFRICVKELFVKRFDPLTVSYAVLSDVCQDDWTYFKGYCYRKVSSCDSWNGGEQTCTALEANLPSIHSQEENVYVQSLHGGEHSWLGLSDINSEGTFVWSDGTRFDFHYWAKHQPNNFHNEDCVHTLGFLQGRKYEWNDINCTDCHRFTCKRDYNECKHFSYDCPVNATCVNNNGSYLCQCPVGYRLDGKNCTDVNECLGSYSCHSQAQCVNIPGSYSCRCLPGYTGDGKNNCSKNQPYSSCKEIYNHHKEDKPYPLQTEFGTIAVYCYMTGLGACKGGGWTLVMKIDGTKLTFHYDSKLWSNKAVYNLPGGITGLDAHETKLPTYWSTPFKKICLGMRIGSQTRFIVIHKTASSLYSLIADGSYRVTALGRNTWKSLVGSQASLQSNCNKEGFNAVSGDYPHSRARIGIIGNQENDCHTCDSRVGFGTGGNHDNSNTCGNQATHSPDNGNKHIKAMGYIFVQ